jgi:hypothetical protein
MLSSAATMPLPHDISLVGLRQTNTATILPLECVTLVTRRVRLNARVPNQETKVRHGCRVLNAAPQPTTEGSPTEQGSRMRKFSFSPRLPQYRKQIRLTIKALGLLLALTSVAHAQSQPWGSTNLYIFQGGISGPDGGTPYGGLILGSDGNYYGTTWYGGTGGGTVFKVTPSGTESQMEIFTAPAPEAVSADKVRFSN